MILIPTAHSARIMAMKAMKAMKAGSQPTKAMAMKAMKARLSATAGHFLKNAKANLQALKSGVDLKAVMQAGSQPTEAKTSVRDLMVAKELEVQTLQCRLRAAHVVKLQKEIAMIRMKRQWRAAKALVKTAKAAYQKAQKEYEELEIYALFED